MTETDLIEAMRAAAKTIVFTPPLTEKTRQMGFSCAMPIQFTRVLMKIAAWLTRRERKKQRRYQHQKRKQ